MDAERDPCQDAAMGRAILSAAALETPTQRADTMLMSAIEPTRVKQSEAISSRSLPDYTATHAI